MRVTNPNVLLVEGADDKRIIPELIEANGHRWGEAAEPKLVQIRDYDGVEKLLAPGEVSAQLKGSGVRSLGIVIDANGQFADRWRQVRHRCQEAIGPILPEEMPRDGMVVERSDGKRLGVWIMPDNHAAGMMETFLGWLRPRDAPVLLAHAEEACDRAAVLGAAYKAVHRDKALIHTWLAWQIEPGRQLHQAVKYRLLDPVCEASKPFVGWFERLFRLGPAPGLHGGHPAPHDGA